MRLRFTIVGVILFVLAMSTNVFAALNSEMSLSSAGPFKVNDVFTVQIKITGTVNFSGIDGKFEFSKEKLKVTSIRWNPVSLAQFGLERTDLVLFANTNGSVSFTSLIDKIEGLKPADYGNPILTITFQCIAAGTASIGNSDSKAWTLVESNTLAEIDGSYPLQSITINSIIPCIPVQDNLALNICAEYQSMKYGFTLNYFNNPHGLDGHFWKADTSTFAQLPSDPGNCVTVGDDLALNICAEYQGHKFGFTLNFNPYADPKNGMEFYWKADVSTFKEIR
jgi:hypothetical protein